MTTDAGTPTPLRQAMIAFDDFLNEPPEYEGDRTVRWYRHEAYRKWVPVQTALTAAEAERDALRQAMGFAQGAIEDAIYTEDGLDGETGERVLHIMQEAVERGTFDQTQIGSLPRPMLETENDALRARVAGLEALVRRSKPLRSEDVDSWWEHRHNLLAPSSEVTNGN